jgi:hypothetical protein
VRLTSFFYSAMWLARAVAIKFKEQNVRWVARVIAAIQNQCDNNEDAANTPMADNYDLWQTGP